MKLLAALVMGTALVLLAVFLLFRPATSAQPLVTIRTGNGPVSFAVEIADQETEREQGLMFRTSLPEDRGMLFAFEDEAPRTFWMKNTLIPLDIIFISGNGTILSIQDAVPCESDPCPLYPSGAPAKYVLEISGGLANRLGVRAGQQVQLP